MHFCNVHDASILVWNIERIVSIGLSINRSSFCFPLLESTIKDSNIIAAKEPHHPCSSSCRLHAKNMSIIADNVVRFLNTHFNHLLCECLKRWHGVRKFSIRVANLIVVKESGILGNSSFKMLLSSNDALVGQVPRSIYYLQIRVSTFDHFLEITRFNEILCSGGHHS